MTTILHCETKAELFEQVLKTPRDETELSHLEVGVIGAEAMQLKPDRKERGRLSAEMPDVVQLMKRHPSLRC